MYIHSKKIPSVFSTREPELKIVASLDVEQHTELPYKQDHGTEIDLLARQVEARVLIHSATILKSLNLLQSFVKFPDQGSLVFQTHTYSHNML